MSVLTGVLTNKGRETLAKSFGNVGGFPLCRATKFAFGEGGFDFVGGVKEPKVPSPSLTNIEADGITLYRFEKNLTTADVTFLAPSTIEFRCKLDPTEANDDGTGNSPEFFEVGLFDDNNNLIVYATFDAQTKVATKALITFIQVPF